MPRQIHINKINNNQSTDVTDTQLPADLICRFEVGIERCFFDIRPLVARALLMSIDTNASVGSITIDPPEGGGLHAGNETLFAFNLIPIK